MNVIATDYLERLDSLQEEINKTIDGLPQNALDWFPGPGMNSLAVLVAHTAGSLRYWVGDVAGEDPSGRDRPAEFRTQGVSWKILSQKLADSIAYAHEFLPRLADKDLGSTRFLTDRQVTVSWALAHALEHTALHTGHIQLTRQLWDAQSGSP